ncbi:MAG: DUF6056 family protein [Chloroflexota bacterium]
MAAKRMKIKEDLPKYFLWTIVLILGIFAYIEYFQIYLQAILTYPNYWLSKRFILFVIISAAYFGLYSFSFISLIKRKKYKFEIKTKIPNWLIFYFVCVFFIIIPFILIWVRPLWERLIPGPWIKIFLTAIFLLIGAGILSSMNAIGRKLNNLNIILSLGVMGYISYFIFTIVYYRIPFGDDILCQFFDGVRFYHDDKTSQFLGEQILNLSTSLNNVYASYFTWGARLIGYFLIPFLSIFGTIFTALFTVGCFLGIILLTVKNIYFKDNPFNHPVSLLFCFLAFFYFDKGIGQLLMFTMTTIYAFSVFLLLIFFTLLRTLIEKNIPPDKILYLFVNLLGLFAGITHEVYAVIFLFISFAVITISVTEKIKRKQFYYYLIGLTLGILIMYTAPGNFVRMAQSHDANRMVTPLLARISNSFTNFEVFPKNNSQLFYKFFTCLYLVYLLQGLKRIRTKTPITFEDIFFWSAIGMVIFWGIFPFAPPYARFGFLVLISIACLSALSKVDLLTKLCLGKWKQYLSVLLLIIILSNLYVTDAHWMGVFQNHSIRWQETVQEAKASHKEFVYVQKFPSEVANRFTQSKIMNNEKSYKTDYYLRYFGILIIPR